MLRRLLPTLILLGGVLLALGAGLVGLQGIFSSEREQALENLEGRRRALSQYAHQLFKETLERRLQARRADFAHALRDPLHPASDLLLVNRGEQWLPRRVHVKSGTATPGLDLYRRLRRLRRVPAKADPDNPRTARMRLYLRFRTALVLGRRSRIESTFRDLLAHRARFVLPTPWDVPFMLALLEEFSTYSKPDPTLLRMLLRDGLTFGRDRRMEGLQRRLLRQRHRFTSADFDAVATRLALLCDKQRVEVTAFRREADRRPAPAVSRPDVLTRPSILGGDWYAVPDGAQIRGVRVDPQVELRRIAARMRTLRLIRQQDRLEGPRFAQALPVDRIELKVRSPRWSRQRAEIDRRYRLKTGLGVLCGVLALLVLVGALLFHWRRHRYVELKSDFVASVSHELRTPLASIRLLAETLERRTRDVPRVKEYPARIVRDVDGLAFLVENLLSFNRLDKGRWVLRREGVPLAEVVADLDEDLRTVVPRTVELEAEGLEGVTLDADPELLRLLFHNLGRNACLYNERDPIQLEIRAAAERRWWIVTLRDNGVGIPDGERERVFQEFYRVTENGRGKVRGSGLGLAMCRRILALHGGRIRVADTGPDGTTFELKFPRKG